MHPSNRSPLKRAALAVAVVGLSIGATALVQRGNAKRTVSSRIPSSHGSTAQGEQYAISVTSPGNGTSPRKLICVDVFGFQGGGPACFDPTEPANAQVFKNNWQESDGVASNFTLTFAAIPPIQNTVKAAFVIDPKGKERAIDFFVDPNSKTLFLVARYDVTDGSRLKVLTSDGTTLTKPVSIRRH
jgi:hypothetical protein